MKVILLAGTFQALFFTFLILQKKKKELHDYILAAWMLFLAFFIGIYAYYNEDFFIRAPHLISSYISLMMLHGPFLYFYTKALITGTKGIMQYRSLLHFLPPALFNLYLLVAFNTPEIASNVRLDYVDTGVKLPLLYVAFLAATALSGPFYVLLVIRLLHKFVIYLLNHFSYREKINLNWLRYLVFVFGGVWMVLIGVASIHHVMFLFTRDFCTHGLFISLTIFVLLTGYFGLKQFVIIPAAPEETIHSAQEEPRYAGSSLTSEDSSQLMKKLEMVMLDSKPYLDAGLTLQQLSERTDIPAYHLSQVINERFNQNFFDYVNSYRINEVIRKMEDPKFDSYSLLGIAFDSGFNSKSAFNRFFKKATGRTPSEYKSSLISNRN